MNSEQIKDLRASLGDSQLQFAQRFNVSQIAVAHWESGRSRPNASRLDALYQLAQTANTGKAQRTDTLPFRPIQYLGSKQKIAVAISEVVDSIAPKAAHIADLFSGSGVVSGALAAKRTVTAVDIQGYACALAEGLLTTPREAFAALWSIDFLDAVEQEQKKLRECAAELLRIEEGAIAQAASGNPRPLEQIIESGSMALFCQRPEQVRDLEVAQAFSQLSVNIRREGFRSADVAATRYFAGPYFAFEQAIAMDAIYMAAQRLGEDVRAAARAVMLSTASEIVNTVGKQFAQPIKLQKSDGSYQTLLVARSVRDRQLNVQDIFTDWAERWHLNARMHSGNEVRCQDVMTFVREDKVSDVYYADPPYTIDHYSRFYHVLETLVLRDDPALDEIRKQGRAQVMRGIYRVGRHQSDFCIPSRANAAFELLLTEIAKKHRPLILSYSPFDSNSAERPRLLSIERLFEITSRSFRKVELIEIENHSHRKLNSKAVNRPSKLGAERLFVCLP